VSARRELIEDFALRQESRFLEVVERARHRDLAQHGAPIQGTEPGHLPN
jgi:hypothetical protein